MVMHFYFFLRALTKAKKLFSHVTLHETASLDNANKCANKRVLGYYEVLPGNGRRCRYDTGCQDDSGYRRRRL